MSTLYVYTAFLLLPSVFITTPALLCLTQVIFCINKKEVKSIWWMIKFGNILSKIGFSILGIILNCSSRD